jgi:hypothetical protein
MRGGVGVRGWLLGSRGQGGESMGAVVVYRICRYGYIVLFG